LRLSARRLQPAALGIGESIFRRMGNSSALLLRASDLEIGAQLKVSVDDYMNISSILVMKFDANRQIWLH